MMIGPYNLSASMGITAQFDNSKFIKATKLILDKAKEHGILPGIHVVNPNPDEVIERVKEGYKFIAYSLDITILGTYYRQGIKKIREELK